MLRNSWFRDNLVSLFYASNRLYVNDMAMAMLVFRRFSDVSMSRNRVRPASSFVFGFVRMPQSSRHCRLQFRESDVSF